MNHHSNLSPSNNSVSFESYSNESFIPQGQRVPFINGAKWIDQSIKMFLLQPKSWLFVTLIFLALDIISSYVMVSSLVMKIITLFLTTLIFAGVVCMAESQRLTGNADLQLINKGVTERFWSIAIVILTQIAIVAVGLMSSFWILGMSFLNHFNEFSYAIQVGDQERAVDILIMMGISRLFKAFLVFMSSVIFAEMLTRFAIPLIMLQNYSVGQAFKASCLGCLKNIPAAAVYFASLIILIVIGTVLVVVIPALENVALLFWTIITIPCHYIATYVAYRDIFHLK